MLWNRTTISQRIGISLGLLVLLVAILGTAAWINIGFIEGGTQTFVEGTGTALKASGTVEALKEANGLISNYAVSESDGDLARAREAVETLGAKFAELGTVAGDTADLFRDYNTTVQALLASIAERRAGGDEFEKAATALTTTSSAVVAALVREKRLEALAAGVKLHESQQAGMVAATRFIASRDPAHANLAKQQVNAINEAVASLKEGAGDSNRIQRFLKALEPQIADYLKAIDALINATQKFGQAGSKRQQVSSALISKIEQMRNDKTADQDRAMVAMRQEMAQARVTIGGIGTLAALIAIILAVLVGRGISRPIIQVSGSITEIAKGELSVTIPHLGQKNEIGAIANAAAVLKERLAASREAEAAQAEKERQLQEKSRLERIALAERPLGQGAVEEIAVGRHHGRDRLVRAMG